MRSCKSTPRVVTSYAPARINYELCRQVDCNIQCNECFIYLATAIRRCCSMLIANDVTDAVRKHGYIMYEFTYDNSWNYFHNSIENNCISFD